MTEARGRMESVTQSSFVFSCLRSASAACLLLIAFPAGVPSAAQPSIIFFDDFSGTLDRSKWNVIVTGTGGFDTVNDEQQAYVDSRDTLAVVDRAEGAQGGVLAIRGRRAPAFRAEDGKSYDFVSGRVDTRSKFDFTYGTAAARIKLTAGAGLWPAFWALGNGDWPDTGEIDIMENVGDPAWVNFALHGPKYSGGKGLVQRSSFATPADITGWHVYAVRWTRDALVFTVDDREAWRVSRAMVETHGRWAYDNPKHLILNQAIGGVYPHAVNRVARPYYGLPQATVDLINDGRAVMLVDWVRVTQP